MGERQKPSAGLTLVELDFCFQYCAFVESRSDLQPGEDEVRAFLRRSILPTDVQYPAEWSSDERLRDEAADRFLGLTQHLQNPKTDVATPSMLDLTTLKRLAWFFLVGFVGNGVLRYVRTSQASTAERA